MVFMVFTFTFTILIISVGIGVSIATFQHFTSITSAASNSSIISETSNQNHSYRTSTNITFSDSNEFIIIYGIPIFLIGLSVVLSLCATLLSSSETSASCSLSRHCKDTSIRAVESPDDEICSICRDTMVDVSFVSKCKHAFHVSCINRHLSYDDRCPMCRGSLKDDIEEQ